MSALEALDSTGSHGAPAPAAQSMAQGLYERHSQRILGFCLRRLATREEAEDAVQTTFLYALRALQRGVVPVSESAWLFKIAENVCLATHRSNGRRRAREQPEPDELPDRAPARELDGDVARELVKALGTIPVNQRKALLLREWRGLSYREIAVHLGVSVGAVETLIFRARKGMARALNGEAGIRQRLAGIFDLGAVLNILKAAFGSGATAAKLAGAAAVVAVATLPAGDSPSRAAAPTREAPAAGAAVVGPSTGQPVTPPASDEVSSLAMRRKQGAPTPAKRRRTTDKPSAEAPASTEPGAGGSEATAPPSTPSLPVTLPAKPPAVPPVSQPQAPELPVELPPVQLPVELPVQLPELPVQLPELPVELPENGELELPIQLP